MDNQVSSKTINLLKTLADENRFQIVELLLKSDLCVGALARILKISEPAVSQHLKILREAGLIRGEKRGYWTHYRVERELLQKTARHLHVLSETADEGSYICLRVKDGNKNTEGRMLTMCKNCCEKPEKLKDKPEKCTPEQIKECHGDEQNHPCECDKE